MKAVIYHADCSLSAQWPPNTYKKLFADFKKNLNDFDIPVIHLTTTGHEGWGDENYYYDLDPENIVYNRESTFVDFLRTANDDVYWFTEPDTRLNQLFPPLTTDLAILLRGGDLPISPWWRLAKKSALPFFERALEFFDLEKKQWHGDSVAFKRLWDDMNCRADFGQTHYLGLAIELREYALYSKPSSPYSRQWKSKKKLQLLDMG